MASSTQVTEWPATIDRRYHDAVILDVCCVVAETASIAAGVFESRNSIVPLLRRLQDAGVATAVYSSGGGCAEILRATGLDDLVTLVVEVAETSGKLDAAALAETASRLGTRPVRCVVIDCDLAGITAARDGGFSLVIGLERNGYADQMLSCGADTVVADLAGISVRRGGTAMSAVADAMQVYSQLKDWWRPGDPRCSSTSTARRRRSSSNRRRRRSSTVPPRRCGPWRRSAPSR